MLLVLAALGAFATVQQTDTTVAVAPGTRLEVKSLSGDITVKTWAQSAVRVQAEHGRRDSVVVTVRPGVLEIRNRGRHGFPSGVDYVITAPASMALTLSGVSTNVDIDGSEAAVGVETISGTIRCRGGRGDVSLQSVNGAIELRDATGRIEVHTVSDDIVLASIAGDVSAETVSGDIRLQGIESSRVDVSTVSGDVSYDGAIKDDGHYRFSTHNGDLAIGFPAAANATVAVSTFNGDFDASFPVAFTGSSKHNFTFALGSGTARVDLESFNGDVKLRRPAELRTPGSDDSQRDEDRRTRRLDRVHAHEDSGEPPAPPPPPVP